MDRKNLKYNTFLMTCAYLLFATFDCVIPRGAEGVRERFTCRYLRSSSQKIPPQPSGLTGAGVVMIPVLVVSGNRHAPSCGAASGLCADPVIDLTRQKADGAISNLERLGKVTAANGGID